MNSPTTSVSTPHPSEARLSPSPRFVLTIALFACALFIGSARQVLAAGPGSFVIKTPEVEEKGGEWHVKVRIDLPRPPAMMHTPMRFTFSKDAVDERAIMSRGAEPVHHRVVLETAAKQIVSLDVDFANASGKVFKSTYFEFDLKRADGYFEAGEYVVTLSGIDGEVGSAQHLVLKGDNPPVYRGAMDFADNKSTKQKGPKMEKVNSGVDGGQEVAKNDTSGAGPASTDVAAVGEAPGMVPDTAFKRTSEEESVKEHPKGCGCVTVGMGEGSTSPGAAAATVALGLVAAFARRRRR
ncbi:MAG: MYXO-CTERM sorting domain-containing protein [Myxococcota bacterium]|nr:MYXO-CTERM sorting domain-containing protein [Myxococcota bacterium]